MSKEYWWCVPCSEGDFYVDRRDCPFRDCSATYIPVVKPLDVPEPTTWGESGGAEAVCAEYSSSPAGAGGVLDYVRVEDKWFETTASVYDSGEVIIHESTSGRPTGMNYRRCDIVAAINYVAGR